MSVLSLLHSTDTLTLVSYQSKWLILQRSVLSAISTKLCMHVYAMRINLIVLLIKIAKTNARGCKL